MIPYIGDLSRRDAALLQQLAGRSTRVLEFGVGASTQIFAAYGPGVVSAVDTDPRWIAKTRENLAALELDASRVRFYAYDEFCVEGLYDLIFVDGLNELRLPFAIRTWPALAIGGRLCFHDTRRTEPYGRATTSDVQHVAAVLERFALGIDTVVMNQADSNISVVTKRPLLKYEDYNAIEGRTPAQLGLA